MKLISSCCFSHSLCLFWWQRWHSSYKPKQQFLLLEVVERYNNKNTIWQRNNKRSFYAQNPLYSWFMCHCHLTITHFLTDQNLVWMNRNFFLCNEMFSVFLYFIDNFICYWFMFTNCNVNFLKSFIYATQKSLSTEHPLHMHRIF